MTNEEDMKDSQTVSASDAAAPTSQPENSVSNVSKTESASNERDQLKAHVVELEGYLAGAQRDANHWNLKWEENETEKVNLRNENTQLRSQVQELENQADRSRYPLEPPFPEIPVSQMPIGMLASYYGWLAVTRQHEIADLRQERDQLRERLSEVTAGRDTMERASLGWQAEHVAAVERGNRLREDRDRLTAELAILQNALTLACHQVMPDPSSSRVLYLGMSHEETIQYFIQQARNAKTDTITR